MKLAPLTLERYFAEHFEVTVNPKCDLREPLEMRIEDLQVDSQIDYMPGEDLDAKSKNATRRGKVALRISYQPTREGNFPYSFKLDLIGFFTVPIELPGIEPHRLLELNACSILFGVAREMIANFTSRGPFPFVLLPSISFPTEKPEHASIESEVAKTEQR